MTAALVVLVWLLLGWLAWLVIGGMATATWLVLTLTRNARDARARRDER